VVADEASGAGADVGVVLTVAEEMEEEKNEEDMKAEDVEKEGVVGEDAAEAGSKAQRRKTPNNSNIKLQRAHKMELVICSGLAG
jgi:hypothetical protein